MRKKTPAYRRQCRESRDLAFVELNGIRHYLGAYDSPESREKYHRLLAEWSAADRQPLVDTATEEISVMELAARYWAFAEDYYRPTGDRRPAELYHVKKVLRLLKESYGSTPARAFGPRALKAIREHLVAERLCRKFINQSTGRIKRIFKWAVAEELVPPATLMALQAVPGLKRGRSEARESEEVRPVPHEHVEAIHDHVSRQVLALVQLQLFTAARQGELVIMRPCDLDRSGDVWTYAPSQHKTAHHGHARTIYLGPKAQAVVEPFLKGRAPGAFLFSPAEAEEERLASLHAARKTPLSCGNVPGSNRSRAPKGKPREHYDRNSYARAIARACQKAGVPHWHPHQLRHNAATHVRREFGLEMARVICGQKSLDVAAIYAEQDKAKALDVMGRIG